jgi:dipeptidyl aminopeptidase/acylaminoacyl peptidase
MHRPTVARFVVLVLAALVFVPLVAQEPPAPKPSAAGPAQAAPGPLTIDLIMKGEDFVGTAPSGLAWAVDGKTLYFQWKKPGAKSVEAYAVSAASPVPRPVKPEEMLKLPPLPAADAGSSMARFAGIHGRGGELQYDVAWKRAVFAQGGDLYLLDVVKGTARRLTATDERESGARFSRDQGKIIFMSGDNLFAMSLGDGLVSQMTSFTRTAPPPEDKPDEIEKWYADHERELFPELRKEPAGRPGGRELFPFLNKGPRRKPFVLTGGQRVMAELAPDEQVAVFTLTEQAGAKPTIVPNYITRSGYTETIESHPKAAESGQEIKAGVIATASGEVKWLDYGQGDRKVFPGRVLWSPDGRTAVLTARADDRKDQWLLKLDPATGKTTVLFTVHDDAWVGPLGLTNIFFRGDGGAVLFISEKEGYAHLHQAPLDGGPVTALTGGAFEVTEAALSKDGTKIYLTTSEEHPGERHFYVMAASGGPRTRITPLSGWNDASLSPDEATLAVLFSTPTTPPEIYLQANSPRAEPRRITVSTTEAFGAVPWYDPEVIAFPARDGVKIHARLFTPVTQDPRRPAVIFLHGAGYLQNAHRGWSSYSREYMFHNLLMEHGYVVLDLDYRGSSGYGRDFRTGIYRAMGGKDLEDVVDGAKFLVEKVGVAPDRIGCYGGSYGGFLTLMALFKSADVFKAGAALRPVTDWSHYHPGYTVDILNLPQKDPEAYQRSSPIHFAEGFQGGLLICHGMVDTNVHFQDTVRLVQRLVDLGKEGFETAFYPVENHAFTNASSWSDEYKRIFRLFERELKK